MEPRIPRSLSRSRRRRASHGRRSRTLASVFQARRQDRVELPAGAALARGFEPATRLRFAPRATSISRRTSLICPLETKARRSPRAPPTQNSLNAWRDSPYRFSSSRKEVTRCNRTLASGAIRPGRADDRLAVIAMVALLALAAFAIDVGYVYYAHRSLQASGCSTAAALAGRRALCRCQRGHGHGAGVWNELGRQEPAQRTSDPVTELISTKCLSSLPASDPANAVVAEERPRCRRSSPGCSGSSPSAGAKRPPARIAVSSRWTSCSSSTARGSMCQGPLWEERSGLH